MGGPEGTLTPRVVCLMCSEVSALAGRNNYKTQEEAIMEHMQKYEGVFVYRVKEFLAAEKSIHKHNYEILLRLLKQEDDAIVLPAELFNLKFYSEKIKFIRDHYPQVAQQFDALETKEQEIITEDLPFEVVQRVTRQVTQQVAEDNADEDDYSDSSDEEIADDLLRNVVYKPTHQLSDEIAEKVNELSIPKDVNLEEIKSVIRSRSAAIAGTLNEAPIYKRLKSMSYDVRQPQKGYRKQFNIGGHKVRIFGKIDGLLYKDGKLHRVVEIKNRRNRFWLPDYEMDQIAFYEKLTDLPSTLVQCFDGELKVEDLELRSRIKEILHSKTLVKSVEQIKWHLEHPYSEKSIKLVKSLIKN